MKPQGPRKPMVMETPVPINGGNDWRSALTVCPPFPVVMVLSGGLSKSNLKEASLGIRLMRSAALAARMSSPMRSTSFATDTSAGGAGETEAVATPLEGVVVEEADVLLGVTLPVPVRVATAVVVEGRPEVEAEAAMLGTSPEDPESNGPPN